MEPTRIRHAILARWKRRQCATSDHQRSPGKGNRNGDGGSVRSLWGFDLSAARRRGALLVLPVESDPTRRRG